MRRKNTILVLGDQLNRQLCALAGADPERDRVLMIESRAMIEGRNYHRSRMARRYHSLEQLGDLEQVAERAAQVVRSIRGGRLEIIRDSSPHRTRV